MNRAVTTLRQMRQMPHVGNFKNKKNSEKKLSSYQIVFTESLLLSAVAPACFRDLLLVFRVDGLLFVLLCPGFFFCLYFLVSGLSFVYLLSYFMTIV